MRVKILFLFCFILFLATDISYAAGLLMRIQQMKQQKEQQNQGMTPDQYRQYQEYQEQQRGDQNQQPTYQQTVDQRNQAIAQAILNAHNQAITSENQEVNTQQAPQQTASLSTAVQQQQTTSQASPSNVQDVVDLTDVWKKLDNKSTVWSALIDDQAKLLTVSEYISRFQKEGVKINEPPTHYVQMIDQISKANPQMLQRPFGELLQILAIVDYDFDNGMNKDDLAKKVLGEAGYEANKKRFTQQS